jgi:hypothetical protein
MISVDVNESNLNLLRISLDLTGVGAGPRVLFDIRVGGEQIGLLEASSDEIGLPPTLSEARERDASDAQQVFHIPDYVLTALESVIPPDGKPLWLSLGQPYGYLPIVPWERLLGQRLSCPFLRLPYSHVNPVASRTSIDAVLCFSFPISKRRFVDPKTVISQLVQQFPAALGTEVTLHIFGDAEVQPILQSYRERFANSYRVEIYDPRKAADYEIPNRSTTDTITQDLESPWLLWIRDSLSRQGTAADVVHFVCHGYLGRDQGHLAFSQSPLMNEDPEWARFVGARQLCRFLDQVGAWSVSFSSPPRNHSVGGLRFLQEQVAQFRCGPVLLHEMEEDKDGKALDEAFRYIYETGEQPAPKSRALSLYCHPDWEREFSTGSTTRASQLVDDLTLLGRLGRDQFEKEKAPFAASFQRSLERTVSQLDSEPKSEEEGAAQKGVEDALRFTSDVVARHLKKWREESQ